MPRSLAIVPKFDHYCRWSKIKINSNYIDKVSRDRFLGDLRWLFHEEVIKKINCEKNKIVRIKL